MSTPNNSSFNDSELSSGLHLLTGSAAAVKVNTPSVPPNTAHRYPRLAGSDWTSYLTQPRVVLGRSGTVASGQKRPRKHQNVDIDFEGCKMISRRHCEVRYSARRERWELYVYGINGVKINRTIKKPRDKPTVLNTSSLIEIGDNSFLFILPDNYIKPRYPSERTDEGTDSEANTPKDSNPDIDRELEASIASLFEPKSELDTKEILDMLREKLNRSTLEKETVLHLLALSPKFCLAPNSKSMSSKESALAKWTLLDSDKSITSEQLKTANESDTVGASSSLETNSKDDAPLETTSPPPLLLTPSLAKLFNDEENEDDREWSVVVPNSPSEELIQQELDASENKESSTVEYSVSQEKEASPVAEPPVLFRGLSIESMYSIWTNSSSSLSLQLDEPTNIAPSPPKRLRQTNSDDSAANAIDVDSGISLRSEGPLLSQKDIYKQVRTTILH